MRNSDIGYQSEPDVIVVHSQNVAVIEQTSFARDHRTLVLICTDGTGYAAVGKKVASVGYLTLARWEIETRLAVTFTVPNSKTMSIQQVPVDILLARYQSEQHLWVTITSATRYHVQHPITR
jgi:hypothetical protein